MFCTSVGCSLLLPCGQLRFSLYSGAVTTKALAVAVLLLLFLVSSSVEYPMPYASCLVSCSVDWSCSSAQPACPDVLCFMQLSFLEDLGFFYPVHICTVLWNSLSGLVHSGLAFLASQAPDWAVTFCLACDWLPFGRCPSKHVYCKTVCDWLPL